VATFVLGGKRVEVRLADELILRLEQEW